MKATLERCVFCPKLCRVACPVGNAEPRETLTPWGKMSMTYFVANESVELSLPFAEPAWACTGCFGCRDRCDHKNDVTGTLFASRSALRSAGQAPAAARRVIEQWPSRTPSGLAADPRLAGVTDPRSKVAVLAGCASGTSPAAIDAVRAVSALAGGAKVAVLDACCGAPLLYAGDQTRFAEAGARMRAALSSVDRLVVADAGCASTLRLHHAAAGCEMPAEVLHLAELAAREIDRLRPAALGDGPVRWHDPCQLGRGLGVYEAPRQILSRVLGRAPDEFERRREHAACSGAGGLLPVTMPEIAKGIAEDRAGEHHRAGGGTVITACASSARSFARAGVEVLDLATVIARATASA
jgi:Fe-S oxidoreductase